MIPIKVKSIYMGKVAVRDKYLKKARRLKQGLEISYGTAVMRIPYGDIMDRVVGRSEKPVCDYFSDKEHYLIYFKWKPQTAEEKEKEFHTKYLYA